MLGSGIKVLKHFKLFDQSDPQLWMKIIRQSLWCLASPKKPTKKKELMYLGILAFYMKQNVELKQVEEHFHCNLTAVLNYPKSLVKLKMVTLLDFLISNNPFVHPLFSLG